MHRGEIWLVSLDHTEGHEQQGTWPVLIISPLELNQATHGLPIVLPITSRGNFSRLTGLTVPLDDAGTRTSGVVRCDQPRTLDMHARNGKRLERVSDAVLNEVLAIMQAIIAG